MLTPQAEMEERSPLTELCLASKSLYSSFVQKLVSETGIDIEFSESGLLYVGFSPEEQQKLEGRYRWQKELGLSVEWLSCEKALELEGNLNPNVFCALFFPKEAHVDNAKLMEALQVACAQRQVKLAVGCQAVSVRAHDQRVIGVESD